MDFWAKRNANWQRLIKGAKQIDQILRNGGYFEQQIRAEDEADQAKRHGRQRGAT